MKKSNIVIILLLVVVFGLSGYIVYDKILSDNKENDKALTDNKENDNKENDNIKLSEWAIYLNNYELILTESVWNNDADECEFSKVSITSDNIKKVFAELSNKKITKKYYGDMPPTGTICSNRYKLQYGKNSISLEDGGVVWVNDDTLSSKLDLDVDSVVGTNTGGYVYLFDVDFAELISKYTK